MQSQTFLQYGYNGLESLHHNVLISGLRFCTSLKKSSNIKNMLIIDLKFITELQLPSVL